MTLDYHQRLYGELEPALAALPPRILQQLRSDTTGTLPAEAKRRLLALREGAEGWMHEDDLAWLARAWARYRTELPERHRSDSIAALGARLGVSHHQMEHLWSPSTTALQYRDTITHIIDAARRNAELVCFSRLAWDLSWLRQDRTIWARGRTRAQHIRHQWHTDAATEERTQS